MSRQYLNHDLLPMQCSLITKGERTFYFSFLSSFYQLSVFCRSPGRATFILPFITQCVLAVVHSEDVHFLAVSLPWFIHFTKQNAQVFCQTANPHSSAATTASTENHKHLLLKEEHAMENGGTPSKRVFKFKTPSLDSSVVFHAFLNHRNEVRT